MARSDQEPPATAFTPGMPHPFGYDGGITPSEVIPLEVGRIYKFTIYEDRSRGNGSTEDGPSVLTPEEAALTEIRNALAAIKKEELHNP